MSVFFFFKQKTAYEMRISDWSSDVCSSDLRMAAARGAAFAAAVRVVDRVHGNAAHRRTLAEPAVATGLAELGVGLVRVRHRADRSHALGAHHAHLPGAESPQPVAGIAAHKLHVGTGGPHHLSRHSVVA